MGHAYANYLVKTYILCYRIMPEKIRFVSWQNTVKVKKHTPKSKNDSFNNVGVNFPAVLVVLGLMTF